jgi:hypothetical protein
MLENNLLFFGEGNKLKEVGIKIKDFAEFIKYLNI